MNRILLITIIALTSSNVFSQGLLSYENIVDVDITKMELRKKTEEWFALTYKNPSEVIQLNNEDKIIGKAIFILNNPEGVYLLWNRMKYVIEISFKDNKYRIEIKDQKSSTEYGDRDANKNLNIVSYEQYIDDLRKRYESFEEGKTKRRFLKKLDNQEEMTKDYEEAMIRHRSILEQSNKYNSTLANSFYEYIIQNSSSDDW